MIMKHLATLLIILFSFSLFSQDITTSTSNKYLFSAGVKSRYLYKEAIYYSHGHFGPYKQIVDPYIKFLFTTSVFIIPNSLNFELEIPFPEFSKNTYQEINRGSSLGLTYYFLEQSKVGLHPFLGTSIKFYSIDDNKTFIFPITFGLAYQKKQISFEFSYNQVFQKNNPDYKFYNNFLDLGMKIYFFNVKKLKNQE